MRKNNQISYKKYTFNSTHALDLNLNFTFSFKPEKSIDPLIFTFGLVSLSPDLIWILGRFFLHLHSSFLHFHFPKI